MTTISGRKSEMYSPSRSGIIFLLLLVAAVFIFLLISGGIIRRNSENSELLGSVERNWTEFRIALFRAGLVYGEPSIPETERSWHEFSEDFSMLLEREDFHRLELFDRSIGLDRLSVSHHWISVRGRISSVIREPDELLLRYPETNRELDLFEQTMNGYIADLHRYTFHQARVYEVQLHVLLSAVLLLSAGMIIAFVGIARTTRSEFLIRKLTHALINAQEEERKRIALDIHDDIAQKAALLRLKLESRLLHPQEVLLGGIDELIGTLRSLASTLRPADLDHLGLVTVLERYCRSFSEKYSIPVDFRANGMEHIDLSKEIELHLYRIVSEALNNVRKHAAATTVRIRLTVSPPVLLLSVLDNGNGFDVNAERAGGSMSGHLGLSGMNERVRLLGGCMKITSAPGEGTAIFCEFELPGTGKDKQRGRVP